MSKDILERFAVVAVVLGILVAGFVDADNVKTLPDYTVSCERPVNGMCQIINKHGDFIFEISMEEASDAELFRHPESIQNWLDHQSSKYSN